MSKPEFFQPKLLGDRTWGEELLVAHAPGKYIGKVLKIKKGHGGNFQYHQLKDEAEYIVSGEMIVRYVENDIIHEAIVGPGDALRFPPGVAHQTEALTDVVAIEFSTPHFNDRVRVEKELGIEEKEGLPTTTLDEIELL